ncbi:translational machinery component [Hypoxylon trugodes]|uniref:translational machinery component n=1 Tax=Hypoxylon trugodes TaxID=326681 RepID=UPI002199B8D5|nr:translational machinery component [Hypoxylon trugodes]KAI1386822.1 translational machinery component [Hypoxylon trugodes]
MSRPASRLLAATRAHISYNQPTRQCIRPFSQTCIRQAEPERPQGSLLGTITRTSKPPQSAGPPRSGSQSGSQSGEGMAALQRILAQDSLAKARNQPTHDQVLGEENKAEEDWGPAFEPFHFHVFAHRHNTHITVTKPNRGAIISMSAGNLGFSNSKRGTYDAAYQLTAYVIDKLHQGNWHKKMTTLEVVLRGFGSGREAATKILLGTEGRMLRHKITKVSDGTRLKFGGTRSRKPRRLG